MPAPPARAPRSAHQGNNQRKSCCRDAVCSVPQLDPSAAQLAVPRFDPWRPVTADRNLSIFLNIILKLCVHICRIVIPRGHSFAFTELDPADVRAIGNLIGRRFHRPVERVPHRRPNTLRQIEPKTAAFAAPHHRSPLLVQHAIILKKSHGNPPSSLQGGPYGPPFGYPLEGNLVRCSFADVNLSGLRISRRRTKKLHALRDNFGALALAAVVARLVLAGPQASFDVHLAALLQVFLAALRSLAENYNVVPVGTLLALALLVGVRLVGRDRKARHRLPAGGQMPQFRVLAEMTDEGYSVE